MANKNPHRFGFGELKETAEPTYMKLPKDLKDEIARLRGKKSWGVWLREVVAQLSGSQ